MNESSWVNVMSASWEVIEENVIFNVDNFRNMIEALFMLNSMSNSKQVDSLTKLRMWQNATDNKKTIEKEM